MHFALQPWHLLACIFAGYTNRQQQLLIYYPAPRTPSCARSSALVAFG
jgi:hypothetical protein